MSISELKRDRAWEAINALKKVREEYADVLVVLDVVSVLDIAKFQTDSDDNGQADKILSDDEIGSILWHLGKHVGGSQTSVDLLPAMVQFALDEHERRNLQ